METVGVIPEQTNAKLSSQIWLEGLCLKTISKLATWMWVHSFMGVLCCSIVVAIRCPVQGMQLIMENIWIWLFQQLSCIEESPENVT